jgi:hypothetical protein
MTSFVTAGIISARQGTKKPGLEQPGLLAGYFKQHYSRILTASDTFFKWHTSSNAPLERAASARPKFGLFLAIAWPRKTYK